MNDCHLEKARMVSTKENLKVSQQDTHYNARLKSSVASASPSTSLSSQQSKCSNYSYAASLYKSVISNSILYNDSRGLLGSSELHSSVKKFGETMWLEYLNTANEWQIEGFVEKYKKMKDRAALLKGSLHKKVMTFERWWCVLTDELDLCIQGSVENKSGIVQTEPIIKRIDSHTVASRNSLCKLKNFRDEDCDVPHFIKNRFSCGFPKDWELLRRKWIMFLKAGEPQDFQWKGNDNAAILDSCSSLEKPPGRSLQESSCEEFRKKTQKRNFAFSPLPADTVHGLDSNNAIDEKCDTNSTGNQPRLEEERTNCVMPKRNKPECSNTVTTTKNNFLATERSFDVISDSEDSSDEDNGIVDLDTNCQEAKINDNQYGNKKQSVVMRRTNTPQTLVGTEILLEKWLPILNGRKLCFKGVRSMGSTYIDHTTASVKSRPKSDTVTLVDGNTCKLIGQFHDVHNCLPPQIASKFKCGMPRFWHKVLDMWIVYADSIEGESPSSVINHVADNSKEKNSIVPEKLCNDQGSYALPAVKSNRVQSADDKKKCEMLNNPGAVSPKSIRNAVNSKQKKEIVDRNVKKSKKE